MRAGELCTRIVVFAERDMGLAQAAGLMREHHVGTLVVVEETAKGRIPIGILTDRDIAVGILAGGVDPRTLRVGEVMTEQPVTLREHDDILDALQLMRSRGVRRLPVTDDAGVLVGILSLDDLLEAVAEQLAHLARAIAVQRAHEARTRPARS